MLERTKSVTSALPGSWFDDLAVQADTFEKDIVQHTRDLERSSIKMITL